MTCKRLAILGTRGIPARYGGFETFAERLALYLVGCGWRVSVYCQLSGEGGITRQQWRGVELINVPVGGRGVAASVLFDWRATLHSRNFDGLILTLGYNTAIFGFVYRCFGKTNLINMDGIEWRRDKWGWGAKSWFWVNERIACHLGNHLVADHPEIKAHLCTRIGEHKITMIPYGADRVTEANPDLLRQFGLEPGCFSLIVARPEPENSILEMVRAFSRRRRDHKLVVLGELLPSVNGFHAEVLESASNEVLFPGAIYDSAVVGALRLYCRFYLHGHRVGGTNPSLVEALGAGCAVIAQDNRFNRWVAGSGAAYFVDEDSCAKLFDAMLLEGYDVQQMKECSLERYNGKFRWNTVLKSYQNLLERWYPSA